MHKRTQRESNPFPYTDSNKRYYTYDYYMKQKFGGKCVRIPLDAGFSCPNIDGRCGTGGCIYCSPRGSGDFAQLSSLSISEQFAKTRAILSNKWDTTRCIAYFQAHTNTYAPVPLLRQKYEEALAQPGVVGMSIATRADCLPEDVLALLSDISERTALTVELGLQSSDDRTAERIHRGHRYAAFCDGYTALRTHCPRVRICVHLIFGLPGEGREEMLRSVRDVALLMPDEVKLHLLHVLRGTALAGIYEAGGYIPMERQDYIDTVTDALTLLPPTTVIDRLTGDGMADALLAPEWSRKKVTVINDIDKQLYRKNQWQGIYYQNPLYDLSNLFKHESGGSTHETI